MFKKLLVLILTFSLINTSVFSSGIISSAHADEINYQVYKTEATEKNFNAADVLSLVAALAVTWVVVALLKNAKSVSPSGKVPPDVMIAVAAGAVFLAGEAQAWARYEQLESVTFVYNPDEMTSGQTAALEKQKKMYEGILSITEWKFYLHGAAAAAFLLAAIFAMMANSKLNAEKAACLKAIDAAIAKANASKPPNQPVIQACMQLKQKVGKAAAACQKADNNCRREGSRPPSNCNPGKALRGNNGFNLKKEKESFWEKFMNNLFAKAFAQGGEERLVSEALPEGWMIDSNGEFVFDESLVSQTFSDGPVVSEALPEGMALDAEGRLYYESDSIGGDAGGGDAGGGDAGGGDAGGGDAGGEDAGGEDAGGGDGKGDCDTIKNTTEQCKTGTQCPAGPACAKWANSEQEATCQPAQQGNGSAGNGSGQGGAGNGRGPAETGSPMTPASSGGSPPASPPCPPGAKFCPTQKTLDLKEIDSIWKDSFSYNDSYEKTIDDLYKNTGVVTSYACEAYDNEYIFDLKKYFESVLSVFIPNAKAQEATPTETATATPTETATETPTATVTATATPAVTMTVTPDDQIGTEKIGKLFSSSGMSIFGVAGGLALGMIPATSNWAKKVMERPVGRAMLYMVLAGLTGASAYVNYNLSKKIKKYIKDIERILEAFYESGSSENSIGKSSASDSNSSSNNEFQWDSPTTGSAGNINKYSKGGSKFPCITGTEAACPSLESGIVNAMNRSGIVGDSGVDPKLASIAQLTGKLADSIQNKSSLGSGTFGLAEKVRNSQAGIDKAFKIAEKAMNEALVANGSSPIDLKKASQKSMDNLTKAAAHSISLKGLTPEKVAASTGLMTGKKTQAEQAAAISLGSYFSPRSTKKAFESIDYLSDDEGYVPPVDFKASLKLGNGEIIDPTRTGDISGKSEESIFNTVSGRYMKSAWPQLDVTGE